MPRPRPLYVHQETTRHGKAVWYFQRPACRRVRLHSPFGTPEFMAEYQAALAGNVASREPIRAPPPPVKIRRGDFGIGSRLLHGVPPEIAEKAPGFVYFARAGRAVKIGYSKDVKKRVAHFRTGASEKIEIVARVPGSLELERHFHKVFAEYHSHGEWFRVAGRLEDVLRPPLLREPRL